MRIFNDLVNTRKYKKIANKFKLKYESSIESQLEDKEKIIKLQDKITTYQEIMLKQKDKIIELQNKKLKK